MDIASVKFSVLMPTKDRPQHLRRAVEAVLRQEHWNFELIIKDGGQWGTLDIPDDDRIIYIHGKDEGLGHALGIADLVASGDIRTFAADDDVMEPGALSHVAKVLDNPQFHWLWGRVDVIDENGKFMFEAGADRVLSPSVYWRHYMPGLCDADWTNDVNGMWTNFAELRPGKDCATVLAAKQLRA